MPVIMLSRIQIEPIPPHLRKKNTKYCNAQYQDSHNSMMCQQLGKKRLFSSISNSNNCRNAVKQGRKVHFSKSSNLDVTISRSECTVHLYQLDEEGYSTSVNDMWYTRRELAVFISQARDHVLGFGHRSIDESTRGYERYEPARTQQKAMTRKIIILLMQQKALSDEEKVLIACRSSAWAVEDAFVRGCMDFCEAYHPKLSHILEHQHREEYVAKDTEADVSSAVIADTFARSYQQQNKKCKLNNPDKSCKFREIRSRVA
jgi:hypothetical protein